MAKEMSKKEFEDYMAKYEAGGITIGGTIGYLLGLTVTLALLTGSVALITMSVRYIMGW